MGEKSVSSIETLGERLKIAREKKGLSIEDVQKETKIHSTVLRAIEEGRCDDILTPTYVYSFLKKYSQYLGLDTRDISKEYAEIHKKNPSAAIAISSVEEADRSAALRRLMFLAGIALIIFITFLVLKFAWSKASPFLKNIGKKSVAVERYKGKKQGSLKPVQVKSSTKEAVRKADDTKKPDVSIKETAKVKPEPFKMTIKVNRDVMVKVKKDGTALFGRVLPKGSSETISASSKVELYTARGEAIEIIINGKSYGSPGRGILKNIEITSLGVKVK